MTEPVDVEDDEDAVYRPIGDMLDGLGLHPSHRWMRFTEGDCWEGIHAGIQCDECETMAIGLVCYHELTWCSDIPGYLSSRDVVVSEKATAPCPGSKWDG